MLITTLVSINHLQHVLAPILRKVYQEDAGEKLIYLFMKVTQLK